MALESVVCALTMGTALLMAAVLGCRSRRAILTFGAILVSISLVLAVGWLAQGVRARSTESTDVANRPTEAKGSGYVTSRTCRSCHPHQYATWHASYHRTMTQVASPDSVLGDFDDVRLQVNTKGYFLERNGADFLVRMDAPASRTPSHDDLITLPTTENGTGDTNSQWMSRPVVMTTGSHHYQVYWIPSGGDRKVEYLPFVYLLETQQWIPRSAAFLKPPHGPIDNPTGRWNLECNRCHATHARPRVDNPARLDLAHADTHVAEFGIACEACHGPGMDHVAAHRNPRSRYGNHWSNQPDSSIVQPARLSPRRSSQVCGHCHSINSFYDQNDAVNWLQHGYRYRPGDELEDTRHVVRRNHNLDVPARKVIDHLDPTFLDDHYWSDGMVRVSGREYNGLIESPCHQRGELSCLSCHVMHKPREDPRPLKDWADDQLTEGMEGNRACLDCHPMSESSIPRHTHHLLDSFGSLCYNCHMPHTTYGLLKAIRSHQIDSPGVADTLRTGRPNACNLCHLDQTVEWTADWLSQWYGQSKPRLSSDQRSTAAALLWLLRGDAGQRALLSWSMGWQPAQEASGTEWMAPFLSQLLDDPYPAVRFIAQRSLHTLPGFRDFQYDFVGDAHHRASARKKAFEMGRDAEKRISPEKRSRVLFDHDGNLRDDELKRLLGQRDDSRVNLKE